MSTPLLLLLTKGYLQGKGADKRSHIKNGSLLDHLERVCAQMREWGFDSEAQKVALCYAIYSTPNYSEALVPKSEREAVRVLIGEQAEKLVYALSVLDRTSLQSELEGNSFSYLDLETKNRVLIPEKDFVVLLHILIASELDHMDPLNAESIVAGCNIFAQFKPYFKEPAWKILVSLGLRAELVDEGDRLRFIGHAGLWLSTKEVSLVVDPWLYSSTTASPLLQGFSQEQRTIDYLIPRPVFSTADIAPDVILLSHFHTHHSPRKEILEFAQIKPINIICPELHPSKISELRESIGEELFSRITFHFCKSDTELEVLGIKVKALTHTQKNHLAYLVTRGDSSFMHITDGAPNIDRNSIALGPEWGKFSHTNPTYLFIAAVNHSQRVMTGLTRDIWEHTTLSPVQAAKLSVLIKPKNVGLIGMYNFSIWDSLIEYTPGAAEVENEFSWAHTYLSPSTKILTLRPGDSLPFVRTIEGL